MNTLDDKELQELFAAKRTVEANRRRQETLRRMIEAQAAPKSRRLWPVWTGAAAACIAVLLITLPALFGSESEKPTVVAEAEVPEVVIWPKTTTEKIPAPSTKQKATRKAATIKTIEEIEVIETIDSTEPIKSIEPIPSIETIQPTHAAPAPRVMRRTSTLIACTEGCTVPEGTSVRTDRNIEVTFFANNSNTDNLIYSFEINR